MNKYLSAAAAALAALALHVPAYAECHRTGHINSLTVDETGTATINVRLGGPAATQVFSYAVTDKMVLDAAIAALPGRTRVKVNTEETAVCSTTGGAPPLAISIFVTP